MYTGEKKRKEENPSLCGFQLESVLMNVQKQQKP